VRFFKTAAIWFWNLADVVLASPLTSGPSAARWARACTTRRKNRELERSAPPASVVCVAC
jgi:hypothetical protein